MIRADVTASHCLGKSALLLRFLSTSISRLQCRTSSAATEHDRAHDVRPSLRPGSRQEAALATLHMHKTPDNHKGRTRALSGSHDFCVPASRAVCLTSHTDSQRQTCGSESIKSRCFDPCMSRNLTASHRDYQDLDNNREEEVLYSRQQRWRTRVTQVPRK